jgi:Toprim domain
VAPDADHGQQRGSEARPGRGGRGSGRGRGRSSKGRGENPPENIAPAKQAAQEGRGGGGSTSKSSKKPAADGSKDKSPPGETKQKEKKKTKTPSSEQPSFKKGGDASKGGASNSHHKQGDREASTTKAASQPPKSKEKAKANIAPSSSPSSVPPNQPQQTSDIYYGKGSTITILHVAEKPSIALAITKGLAPSSASVDSVRASLPVHEFHTPGGSGSSTAFPKAPHASRCLHRVTSVAGHVFSVDFPAQFQSWDAVDPAELFQAPIERKPNKGSVVKHLQDQARGVDFIVLWMDCDKEGENINFEVLSCCMHLMGGAGTASGGNYDRVYRAYFSAINPSDIQKAYHALGKPDQNQALAVDARQELDLKIGVAFSRFQTRYFQGRYGDLDSTVLSYGYVRKIECEQCVLNLNSVSRFQLNLCTMRWTLRCRSDRAKPPRSAFVSRGTLTLKRSSRSRTGFWSLGSSSADVRSAHCGLPAGLSIEGGWNPFCRPVEKRRWWS